MATSRASRWFAAAPARLLAVWLVSNCLPVAVAQDASLTLNRKANGYRGIWYMNQPSGDEYVYKYSGGMGTYCAKHKPFAIHCKDVNRTFFCYGGTTEDSNQHLLHMVSYFRSCDQDSAAANDPAGQADR